MTTIVITPESEEECSLLMNLLKKMRIKAKTLSDDDKEDIGLLHMMKEADLDDVVSEEEIMEALRK